MPDADDWRIDHTGIGVSDIGQSAKFYGAALSALGLRPIVHITKAFEVTGSANDSELGGVGYGANYPIFWIDVFHAHGAGQHTAFRARSQKEVQAFHAALDRYHGLDTRGLPNRAEREVALSLPPPPLALPRAAPRDPGPAAEVANLGA